MGQKKKDFSRIVTVLHQACRKGLAFRPGLRPLPFCISQPSLPSLHRGYGPGWQRENARVTRAAAASLCHQGLPFAPFRPGSALATAESCRWCGAATTRASQTRELGPCCFGAYRLVEAY